ncbi:MAG: dihydrofolate reductase family protein, partial [Microthrixaceae bacterium]|nr:dihydrofolate reductase family protein [Microthrixaceae bacterium]
GAFPADQPFLNGDGPDPLVYRPCDISDATAAPPGTIIVDAGVEVRRVAGSEVSPTDVINDLGRDDVRVILCEGGPNLLGQLCEAGLLNQLFVTFAPKLAGGARTGLLGKTDELGLDLELITGLEDSGFLMLNYHVTNND